MITVKITKFPNEFVNAIPVLKTIEKAGFEAYFVGGCVRDTLLGIPLHDVDITSSAYPAEIKEIFNRTVDTGIEHGTVMVLDHGEGYEVTTFRTESTYQDFRRPDHVTFVRSLDEDLKRRDLTINALAMDADGNVVDLFHGLDDLKNKIIRAVGNPYERYHEDALRMMRSIRFMSQLDFNLESETEKAIEDNAHLLEKIAIERIHVEWIKTLLGQRPQLGVQKFISTGLYQYCPDFANFKDGLTAMSKLDQLHLDSEIECWILMGHMFGLKPQKTAKLMRDWKSSNDLINQAELAQTALENQAGLDDPHVLFETGKDLTLAANHILNILNQSTVTDEEIKTAYEKLPIKSSADIAVDGSALIKELGMKPGPQFGKALTAIKNQILDGKLANDHDQLLAFVRENFM